MPSRATIAGTLPRLTIRTFSKVAAFGPIKTIYRDTTLEAFEGAFSELHQDPAD